uniref:Uncharacterized protein LOC113797174 n=1 Tax=Dermatophagoides pteronyssinus TaxID=6956 RepID=A0A6P6YEW9_DERPT|nr:uncharacterized protein LOC113797174 [Dermatophagoides pteronyssinus]
MSSYRTDSAAYQTDAVVNKQPKQPSYNSINKSTADINNKTSNRQKNQNGNNNNIIIRRQWNFCFKFFAFLFSHIGLGLLVFAYTIIGAFLFRHFEEPSIIERNRLIERIRNETVDRLWIETYKLNVLYKENWTTMATKEIEQFQRTLIDSFKDGYWPLIYDLSSSSSINIDNNNNIDSDDLQPNEHHHNYDDHQQQQQQEFNPNQQHLYTRWSFIDSWMYSISIITTIGYANRPLTVEGKLTTIIYALFGIPIMLLFLSTIGSLLGRGLKYLYQFCCHCNPNGIDSSSSPYSFQNLPTSTPTTTTAAAAVATTTPTPTANTPNNLNSQDHLQHHHHHDNYQIHHIAMNNIVGNNDNNSGGGGLISTLDMNNIGNKTKNYAQLNSLYPPVSTCNTIGGHYDNRACSCDLLDPTNATTTVITDPTAKLSDPTIMDHHHHICDTKFQTYPGTTTLDPQHHCSNVGASVCDGSPFNTAFHHQSINKLDLDLNHQHLHHHHHHHLYHKLHQSDSSNLGFDDFGANNSRMATDNVPFYFCFLLITLYIMAGSIMFHIWEGLPILDGAYFCFVTLSTIGFGDILPEKTLSSSSSTANQNQTESKKRIIIIVIYILGGMTLVAMSFNLIYEQLAFKFKKIGYKIQLQQQRHQQQIDEIIMKENSIKMMNHHGSLQQQLPLQSSHHHHQQHQSKFQTNEDIDV